jgi:hypothetical protein
MDNFRRIPSTRTRPFSRSGKSIWYGYSPKSRSGKLPNKFIGQLSALEKSLVRVQSVSGEPEFTMYAYKASAGSQKRPCTRTTRLSGPENHLVPVQGLFPAPENDLVRVQGASGLREIAECPYNQNSRFGKWVLYGDSEVSESGKEVLYAYNGVSGDGELLLKNIGEFPAVQTPSLRVWKSFQRRKVVTQCESESLP